MKEFSILKNGFSLAIKLLWGPILFITVYFLLIEGIFFRSLVEFGLYITIIFSMLILTSKQISKLVLRKGVDIKILVTHAEIVLLICIVLLLILEVLVSIGIII